MAIRSLSLRTEQPLLWSKVFSLALTLFLLGLPLLFAPIEGTPNANASILQQLLPLPYHGVIFTSIGLSLFVSGFFRQRNYLFTRLALCIALGYMLMWLLSLIYSAITGEIQSFAIVVIWGFIIHKILEALKDPGFIMSEVIRGVRNKHV